MFAPDDHSVLSNNFFVLDRGIRSLFDFIDTGKRTTSIHHEIHFIQMCTLSPQEAVSWCVSSCRRFPEGCADVLLVTSHKESLFARALKICEQAPNVSEFNTFLWFHEAFMVLNV